MVSFSGFRPFTLLPLPQHSCSLIMTPSTAVSILSWAYVKRLSMARHSPDGSCWPKRLWGLPSFLSVWPCSPGASAVVPPALGWRSPRHEPWPCIPPGNPPGLQWYWGSSPDLELVLWPDLSFAGPAEKHCWCPGPGVSLECPGHLCTHWAPSLHRLWVLGWDHPWHLSWRLGGYPGRMMTMFPRRMPYASGGACWSWPLWACPPPPALCSSPLLPLLCLVGL